MHYYIEYIVYIFEKYIYTMLNINTIIVINVFELKITDIIYYLTKIYDFEK